MNHESFQHHTYAARAHADGTSLFSPSADVLSVILRRSYFRNSRGQRGLKHQVNSCILLDTAQR